MCEQVFTKLSADVLVVGGGGAALRAALAAAEAGAAVLLVSKGTAGKSGATYFSVAELGAFNVPDGAIDPTDSPETFYGDIMDAALGAADPKLAAVVADEAEMAKDYLEDCGMEFARNEDGSYMGYKACFSSKARSHVVKNHFKPIVAALLKKVEENGIRRLEGVTVTDFIVKDGECAGAFAIRGDEKFEIRAGAVVLAAGGASTLFRRNMYPADITGDGYAAAHRAGAVIANMEFIQAGIGLAYPEVNLFGNQLWEAMPRITNGKGERFISRYTVGDFSERAVLEAKGGHFPFSTRDISRFVEIAVQREITEGSPTPRGNVYLDFSETDFDALFKKPGSKLRAMWPLTYERFKELGADLYVDKIEIACFAHAINGGILIDENGESSISGLFAAGEVAAGPHGADRLGGNMSVTCQVFGRRAGAAAAKKAKGHLVPDELAAQEKSEMDFLAGFGRFDADAAEALLDELQRGADSALLIVRRKEKLDAFAGKLTELESRLCSADGTGEAMPLRRMVELRNLVETGRMITAAALTRTESRGSHYRSDYIDTDPRLSKMLFS
ncbi:MAG: FAD-binding protein [Oscillospiraceae bacterium]